MKQQDKSGKKDILYYSYNILGTILIFIYYHLVYGIATSVMSFPKPSTEDITENNQQRNHPRLDLEANHRLKIIRSEIWLGGVKGMFYGLLIGAGMHTLAKKTTFFVSPKIRSQMNNNTLVMTSMVTASIFSYLGSLVQGHNTVANMVDFYALFNSSKRRIDADRQNNGLTGYSAQLLKNDEETLVNAEEAFHRRALAIKQAKEKTDAEGRGRF